MSRGACGPTSSTTQTSSSPCCPRPPDATSFPVTPLRPAAASWEPFSRPGPSRLPTSPSISCHETEVSDVETSVETSPDRSVVRSETQVRSPQRAADWRTGVDHSFWGKGGLGPAGTTRGDEEHCMGAVKSGGFFSSRLSRSRLSPAQGFSQLGKSVREQRALWGRELLVVGKGVWLGRFGS